MKLLKPAWVTHDGNPIFAVDIHPDGSRFATGGAGESTGGRVVVWNMVPVRSEKDEADDRVPKILCTMDNHLACVNCLRWSNSGLYLASGSDDKIVIIWHYVSGTSSGFGGKNVEQWRIKAQLTGHTGDVLDLAWSVNDAWLATCSVDNTAIIWNANKFPEQVAVLKGHTSLVKGVTFDPVGKYVATQSDDKTLRIWRTQDWKEIKKVTEPFQECGGTTHVLRLNWSPDGGFVVSAHAMNNNGPTAQIIERQGWVKQRDFVGHRKAVSCVRFNPKILLKHFKKEASKPRQYCACALGSRDRSLSVWLTALKRPLVVIHDLFSNSILDISWNTNGKELLCCSMDGTVAFASFQQSEIGRPMTKEEMVRYHQKTYGRSLLMTKSAEPTKPVVIESPALLHLQGAANTAAGSAVGSEAQGKQNSAVVTNDASVTPSKSQNSMNPDIQFPTSNTMSSPNKSRQIETRLPNGRRRITPILLEDIGSVGTLPAPQSSSGNTQPPPEPTFSTAKEKSRIVVEQQDSQLPSSASRDGTDDDKPPGDTTPSLSSAHPTPTKEKVVQAKKGLSTPKGKKKLLLKQKSTGVAQKAKAKKRRLELTTVERYSAEPSPRKFAPQHSAESVQMTHPSVAAPPPAVKAARVHELPPAELQPVVTTQVQEAGQRFTVEVENVRHGGAGGEVARIKVTSDSGPRWESVLHSTCLLVAASRHVICAACKDQTLRIFSSCGNHLLLPITLRAPVHALEVRGWHVMIVLSSSHVSVWDVQKKKVRVKEASAAGVLREAGETLTRASLTLSGQAVLHVSSGRTYLYNTDLEAWLLVSDLNNPAIGNNSKFLGDTSETGRLPVSSARAVGYDARLSSLLNASRLSHRLCAAKTLTKQPRLQKTALLSLASALAALEAEQPLRELVEELIGEEGELSSAQSMERQGTLRELLSVVGSNLKMQRLFTELQDQIESL